MKVNALESVRGGSSISISRPLDEGDVLSNANTLIYMGKIREGNRITRGLYIAKHRGSACDERIMPYQIDDRGVRID